MPKPLSELERRILDYLIEYLRQNTYQPSIREIGRRFHIKSTKTVSELLQSLADKGWIERDSSRSRGVRLLGLDMRPQTVTVPWYDRSAENAARDERLVDEFELDRKLAGSAGTFIVAMRGDGMAGDGIRDGDLLLVEPVRPEAVEDGDIVVARLADGHTVKRLYRRGGELVLEPSNPAYSARVLRATELDIAGRVLGIVRRLRVPIQALSPEAMAAPPARRSL